MNNSRGNNIDNDKDNNINNDRDKLLNSDIENGRNTSEILNSELDNSTGKNVKKIDRKYLEKEKIYVKFIIAMALSIVFGFCISALGSVLKQVLTSIDKQEIIRIMTIAVPALSLVFVIVIFAVAMLLYGKNVRESKQWDGEDEEVIDRIEARQNIPLKLSSILMIGGMFLFSLACYLDIKVEIPVLNGKIWIANLCLLVLIFVGSITIQAKVINLEKKLNPEKKGNVFDFNFLKKWEKSSDEAEKLVQYKSGYKGFLAGNFTCLMMWLLSFMGMLIFDTGFLSVFCVCAIWLAMTMVYVSEVMRLERKKQLR